MKITGENVIAADQETVWRGLNDPEVLRQSIPGCESLEKTGDNAFKATVVTRIGPVSARFEGQVELSDLNPPNSYTLSGSGSGGPMGNAKGSARVMLSPHPDGTRLTYDVDAEMTGKIAQLGARLIQSTAGVLAGQFFNRFGDIVARGPDGGASAGAASQASSGGGGGKKIVLLAIVAAAVAAGVYFLAM